MQRLIILASTFPFLGILDRYGVVAVFLFVLVENFGLPIPGETMLVAASAYAASGHLNIVAVALFSTAGVWSGSTLSYLAGKRGGITLMSRLHVPEKHLARAQGYMERWGNHTVALGRYVAFLRSYIGWLAGINGMKAAPFLLWNLVGAFLWSVTFSALGFLVGNNWGLIERILKVLGYGGAALVVIVAIVAFILYKRRRSVSADNPVSQQDVSLDNVDSP